MGSSKPLAAQGVALLGFGDFERNALASYLRLSAQRKPTFLQVDSLDRADYAIADADDPAVVAEVRRIGRAGDTVFIGSFAPEGALAWSMRPIDPLQVFRELDAAVAMRHPVDAIEPPSAFDSSGAAFDSRPGSLDSVARRAGDTASPPLALLLDGSDIALRFLERQLQVLGLRTEAAPTSARALELLARHRFHIVFLDVDLGAASELDGLAMCQQIKRHTAPAPYVVFVSAAASHTDRVRGTLAGCDGYLPKPLDDQALERLLHHLGIIAGGPSQRRRSRRDGVPTSGPMPLSRPPR